MIEIGIYNQQPTQADVNFGLLARKRAQVSATRPLDGYDMAVEFSCEFRGYHPDDEPVRVNYIALLEGTALVRAKSVPSTLLEGEISIYTFTYDLQMTLERRR